MELLELKWMEQGNKQIILHAIPVKIAEKGAIALLKANEGNKYPRYIDMKNADRFGIEVSVENVEKKKVKKVSVPEPPVGPEQPADPEPPKSRMRSKEDVEKERENN